MKNQRRVSSVGALPAVESVLADLDINTPTKKQEGLKDTEKTPRSLRRITSAHFECASSEAFCKVRPTRVDLLTVFCVC